MHGMRRFVRQATKIPEQVLNRYDIPRICLDVYDVEPSVSEPSPVLSNLGDCPMLVNPPPPSPRRASNESMIVGTSTSTPPSISLSESHSAADLAPKDEDGEMVIDLEQTEEERDKKDADLESALAGLISTFNEAKKLPKLCSKLVGSSDEQNPDGIKPVLEFHWLNREHRLANSDELQRVKLLGGTSH